MLQNFAIISIDMICKERTGVELNITVFTKRELPVALSQIAFIDWLVTKTNDYLWPQLDVTYYPIIASRLVPFSFLEQRQQQ